MGVKPPETPEEREARLESTVERARARGWDYAVREYSEFDAAFCECTIPGCGWIEYLGKPDDWQQDKKVGASLVKHTKTHRDGT